MTESIAMLRTGGDSDHSPATMESRAMRRPKVTTETVKVSPLGCMRKSTLVRRDNNDTVEHIELWTGSDPSPTTSGKTSSGQGPNRRR